MVEPDLAIAGADTVLGAFAPLTDERAVVRLGPAADTLLRYRSRGLDVPGYSNKPPVLCVH